MSSLLSLEGVRTRLQNTEKIYRLATLPATCWLEDAILDFGEERGGAKEEVSCSMI